jgi:hypothetical protein
MKLTIVFSVVILFITGCEDLLPPYEQPQNIFAAHVSSIDTITVRYTGGDGSRYMFYSTSIYTFLFSIQNLYDETITGKTNVKGKLEIWPEGQILYKATINFTDAVIPPSSVYNSQTAVLTLDPGNAVFFNIRWNFKFDNGDQLHHSSAAFADRFVNSRHIDRIHSPMQMHARFTAQLFDRSAPVVMDTIVTVKLIGDIIVPP